MPQKKVQMKYESKIKATLNKWIGKEEEGGSSLFHPIVSTEQPKKEIKKKNICKNNQPPSDLKDGTVSTSVGLQLPLNLKSKLRSSF